MRSYEQVRPLPCCPVHTFSVHTFSVHTFAVHTFTAHTFSAHTFSAHTLLRATYGQFIIDSALNTQRGFLRSELSITCGSAEHAELKWLGYGLVRS